MEGGRFAGCVRTGELTFACQNSLKKKTAMRKILFILTMVLSLSASVASAQQRCDSHHGDRPGYEHRGRHHRSPYFVSENKVFFDGREIKGASASSFSILRDSYAKDTWSVYYCGAKMDGASSNSFKVLGFGYAKDTWNVYYDGGKIEGASSNSFDVLPIGMPRTLGMYISTARKSTVPRLRVSRCFVTATLRIHGTCISTQLRLKGLPPTVSRYSVMAMLKILGILTILEEKLTEYERNDNQTAGGTQLLLLDYNISDNRFYLRHVHLLLKNS